MKRCITIFLACIVTFSVVAPRRLDAMVSDDMVAQAMRCQSVVLCYSFFSTIPLKIMSQLYEQEHGSAPAPAAGVPSTDQRRDDSNSAPAPFDLTMPGSVSLVKTTPCHASIDGVQALCGMYPAGWVNRANGRRIFSSAGWESVMRHWMVMLPRGSIDDYIGTIIFSVNEPTRNASRLVFSLGGI